MPKDFDTNAMWYNKEIFDKCGVPYPTDDMSYDDLIATAKALKDSGNLATAYIHLLARLISRHGIIRLYMPMVDIS